MRSNTAILLFSRSAPKEARSKQFTEVKNYYQNRRIASALIEHSQKIAIQSGLPVLNINQRGKTFGERLFYAFEDGFAQGYDKIIAIGNDCPTLHTSHLLEAESFLEHQDVVLGPSSDGGAYLIGLSRKGLTQIPFLQLPWNTAQLFEQFLWSASKHGIKSAQLAELSDIDNAKDLWVYLNNQKVLSGLAQLITAILSSPKRRLCKVVPPIKSSLFCPSNYSRPPPQLSLS